MRRQEPSTQYEGRICVSFHCEQESPLIRDNTKGGFTAQHSTHSVLSAISLRPWPFRGLAPTCISHQSLSLSPCLSLIICAPFKVSVSGSTSRSTKRAVGCGRTRSPSPQYRVPIQVVRRERSGVITTSGGRLLTSASEQKQQHVKMGIEFGSGLREPHAKERRDSLTDTRDARRVAQNIDRRERVR